MKKCTLLAAAVLTLAVAAPSASAATLPPAAPSAAPASTVASSPFAQMLDSKFVDPDRVYSTDVRWWLGQAANTDESLLEQVQELYDAGFRGVELCMQNDS